MNNRVKKITYIAALSAIAFIVMLLGKVLSITIIPAVAFLTYDPKDIVLVLGGLMFGPIASLISSIIVSFFEMLTVSGTGPIGAIMNIISSCAFACTAAILYKKFHTFKGAIVSLISGALVQCVIMMLWNYLITPLYMGVPREAVVALLLPGFLPFNLIKSGLNAALAFLLYKPIVGTLRKSGILEGSQMQGKTSRHIGVIAIALLVILTCVMIMLVINKVL